MSARPCGAMDNASAYGAEDSRFESWQGRTFFFSDLTIMRINHCCTYFVVYYIICLWFWYYIYIFQLPIYSAINWLISFHKVYFALYFYRKVFLVHHKRWVILRFFTSDEGDTLSCIRYIVNVCDINEQCERPSSISEASTQAENVIDPFLQNKNFTKI